MTRFNNGAENTGAAKNKNENTKNYQVQGHDLIIVQKKARKMRIIKYSEII